MYTLTKTEQETIVNFDEKEPTATVCSYNKSWVNKLQTLAEQRPDDVRLIRQDGHGGVTYSIPKRWVKIQPPRIYTEEQRAAMTERLRKAQTA